MLHFGYLPGCLVNRDVDDLDVFLRLLLVHLCVLDAVNYVQALDRPTEDRVLPVQPWLQCVSLNQKANGNKEDSRSSQS